MLSSGLYLKGRRQIPKLNWKLTRNAGVRDLHANGVMLGDLFSTTSYSTSTLPTTVAASKRQLRTFLVSPDSPLDSLKERARGGVRTGQQQINAMDH